MLAGDIIMSKRIVNLLLCISALTLGCVFYVLFRPDSYVSAMFDKMPLIAFTREACEPYSCDFLNSYFLDYLWGVAFSCAFCAVFGDDSSLSVNLTVPFLCGCGWEILQWIGAVNGTGDIFDVIMYFLAALTAYILNKKEKRK